MRRTFLFSLLLLLLPAMLTAKRKEKRSVVRIETTMGTFRVALLDDAPHHRDNFLELVESHFYDGTLFHRVINEFMVQGGDPDSRTAAPGQMLGDGDVDYTLAPEILLPRYYHLKGVLAAAREPDDVNPEQRSSGAQFYIVTGKTFGPASLAKVRAKQEEAGYEMTAQMWNDYQQYGGAPHLDGRYTIFGEVIEGMDVPLKMQKVETDSFDRPLTDIRVLRMVVEKKSKAASSHSK